MYCAIISTHRDAIEIKVHKREEDIRLVIFEVRDCSQSVWLRSEKMKSLLLVVLWYLTVVVGVLATSARIGANVL